MPKPNGNKRTDNFPYVVGTYSGDTYSIRLDWPIFDGMLIVMNPSADNVASDKISLNGGTAVTIKFNGSDLAGTEIKSGKPSVLVKGSTNWHLLNVNGV